VAKLAGANVSEVIHFAISTSVDRLDSNEPALWTSGDPEAVHQARVATRRLRSDLRTLRAFVDPDWARDLRAELHWLGAELGAVRDLEVLQERLSFHAGLLPTPDGVETARAAVRRLDRDHEAARADLLRALGSPRYAQLQHALRDAVKRPRLEPDAQRRARDVLPDAVRPTWRKLRRTVDDLSPSDPDTAFHEVRIRAKRCRYACELASIVFGRRARDLADALAHVQDVLGEQHDAVVAVNWLAKTAPACTPAEAFALGMLAEAECTIAVEARSAFRTAWRQARKPKLRSWL
jgi:CHAD domain-containing protein